MNPGEKMGMKVSQIILAPPKGRVLSVYVDDVLPSTKNASVEAFATKAAMQYLLRNKIRVRSWKKVKSQLVRPGVYMVRYTLLR